MKKFLTAIVAAMFLLMSHVNAEVQTYTGEGRYAMSEGENLGVSKERAKADAMRNAAEKAGVYVRSFSRSKNFELIDDEIITMTSTILQLVGEPQFTHEPLDNLEGFLIRATVTVKIDSDDVLRWLNKDSQERATLIAQNEALRKANEAQERQIAELKRQLAQATTAEAKEQITQKFEAEDKIFLSNQKVDEATKLFQQKKFNEAKKIYDEAINLNPNNAQAWYGRGTSYGSMKKYGRAIPDFDKAIELNPDFTNAYFCRGGSYYLMKNFKQAIADATKTIQLNPNFANAYKFRGQCYQALGEHDKARADFAKARQLGWKG